MGDEMCSKIHDAKGQIDAASQLIEQGLKSLKRARLSLAKCEDIALQNGLDNLPQTDAPISEHRRLHRSGRPPKIDGDPELQAFILARIDRLTYSELATEIENYFPKSRHIKRSAIHSWWQKNKGRFF